ncbi:MAG: MATE family efflux transporter [Clostridia bacterium]|nr:MATE family efflux transporter [Clostridia bacterium]
MWSKTQDLTKGPVLPGIIKYTIPIIITSVLQLLFNACDLVVVGNYCGEVSVAAVGATGSLTNLFVNFFIGFSVGAGVTVAHGLGSQDDEEVHQAVHTSVLLSVVFGTLLTVAGFLCCETFLRWMGTPENVLPLSAVYMKIYFSGSIFVMLYNFVASIIRADGDTKSPLFFLMISGCVNVVLNVIFVTVFHMDVAGVALATLISQVLSAVLVVIALIKRKDSCRLYISNLKIYKEQLFEIIRVGLPAGIQSTVFAMSNVIIQSSVNSFGDMFMSGAAAAGSIDGFVYGAMNAFQQTSVNYVAQNTGARNPIRVKKVFWLCLACVSAVGILLGLSVYSGGPWLLSIYIKDSPQAISSGVIRMTYVALPYFLCGIMEVITGAIRGMGSSLPPMIISVIGVCGIRMVWLFTVFKMFHNPHVLYASYPVSWIITGVLLLVVFFKIYKLNFSNELNA